MQTRLRNKDQFFKDSPSWDLGRQTVSKEASTTRLAEPYSHEEAVLDALGALPSPFMVKRLIGLLRPKELREFTEGILIDCSVAVRTLEPVNCANVINGWVATAEEMIVDRRSRRHILAAKEKADALTQQIG